jgi:hypothetical protein
VLEHICNWVADAGIGQRQISAEEIRDRSQYALVNEGARLLEEGYALRASISGGPVVSRWYDEAKGVATLNEG